MTRHTHKTAPGQLSYISVIEPEGLRVSGFQLSPAANTGETLVEPVRPMHPMRPHAPLPPHAHHVLNNLCSCSGLTSLVSVLGSSVFLGTNLKYSLESEAQGTRMHALKQRTNHLFALVCRRHPHHQPHGWRGEQGARSCLPPCPTSQAPGSLTRTCGTWQVGWRAVANGFIRAIRRFSCRPGFIGLDVL